MVFFKAGKRFGRALARQRQRGGPLSYSGREIERQIDRRIHFTMSNLDRDRFRQMVDGAIGLLLVDKGPQPGAGGEESVSHSLAAQLSLVSRRLGATVVLGIAVSRANLPGINCVGGPPSLSSPVLLTPATRHVPLKLGFAARSWASLEPWPSRKPQRSASISRSCYRAG